MSCARRICTLCDYVYEGSAKGAELGIEISFDELPDSWQCPSCGGAKDFFQPCTCVGYQAYEERERLAETTLTKFTSTAEVLGRLGEIAFSAARSCDAARSFAAPVVHLGPQIRSLAAGISKKSLLDEKDIMPVFFEKKALAELEANSVNYYWFWRIVAESAAGSKAMPIGSEAVAAALQELKRTVCAQFDLDKVLSELTRTELVLYAVAGVVILKHEPDHSYSLFLNPLFKTNPDSIDPGSQIGRIALGNPCYARVFERFGLDFCSAVEKSLQTACTERGITVQSVLRELSACDLSLAPEAPRDWLRAPLKDLVDHLQLCHHAYLRRELPYLSSFIARVVATHKDKYPELAQVKEVFDEFKPEVERHFYAEEQLLFPVCRSGSASGVPDIRPSSLIGIIDAMEEDHARVDNAMRKIHFLLRDYVLPDNACSCYRALIIQLSELEEDLVRHESEENFALYPRLRKLQG